MLQQNIFGDFITKDGTATKCDFEINKLTPFWHTMLKDLVKSLAFQRPGERRKEFLAI
jgi:hypothetical protein